MFNVYSQQFGATLPFQANSLCFDKRMIFACNESKLHCIVPPPTEYRIKKMIDAGHVNGARRLLLEAHKQINNPASLFTYAGDYLFKELKFEYAFPYYTSAIKDYALIKRLIRQYPKLSDKPLSPPEKTLEEIMNDKNLDPKARDTVLKEAKSTFLNWLKAITEKKKIRPDAELKSELNLAMIKLYAEVRPNELQSFTSTLEDRFDNEDSVITYLTASNRLDSLAILHRNMKRYKAALEIWRKLGQGQKDSEVYENETVALLSKISDFTLVKEYSRWIYEKNPKKFKLIWKSDTSDIPIHFIHTFLESINPQIKAFYLKDLILKKKTQDRHHFAELADLYLDAIIKFQDTHRIPEDKLIFMEPLLEEPTKGKPDKSTPEQRMAYLRKKFALFLRGSSFYLIDNHKALLNKIKDYPLRYEKIELNAIGGNHEEAIRLFRKSSDTEAVEKYCGLYKVPVEIDAALDEVLLGSLAHFNPTSNNPRMHALFKIYIEEKNIDKAVELLNKYPGSFDPGLVLKDLPPQTDFLQVSKFLMNSFKLMSHKLHMALVTYNLEKSSNLSLKLEIGKIEETKFRIDRDTVCAISGEKIGDQAFYRYPNGTIALAKKVEESRDTKYVCPKEKIDFRKEPWKYT
uniref:Vacuolar sorting protein 39/Transforming growth factor beta receptor-associated domain-containing protein n=1 Tax=Arcella intermedia TaxID=1963864 RepID=A0A6B2KZQ2_9EUKA